jgi:mono/diheme cytochrome c family protein
MEGLVAKSMLQRGNGSVDDGVVFFAQCNQFGGRNRFCRIISAVLEIGESHSPISLVLFEPVVGVEDVGEDDCIFFGPDADVHGHVLQFNVRRKAVWIVPNRFLNGFVVARLLSNKEPILQDDRNRLVPGEASSGRTCRNGVPIPNPDTRPDLAKPVIYWVPVIAPGNLMFYKGAMFPEWNGSAFASGLASMALIRITFDGKGGAQAAERWNMGRRVRDVEVAPDGALWMIEDAKPGGLFRLTPLGMAVSAPAAQPATPASTPSGSATLDASNIEHVKSVIADNNCLLCHRIGRDGADIGPSLNGLGTRRTADQIRAAIVSPPSKTSAGTPNPMPSYDKKLTEEDLKNLLHYLSTLPSLP